LISPLSASSRSSDFRARDDLAVSLTQGFGCAFDHRIEDVDHP